MMIYPSLPNTLWAGIWTPKHLLQKPTHQVFGEFWKTMAKTCQDKRLQSVVSTEKVFLKNWTSSTICRLNLSKNRQTKTDFKDLKSPASFVGPVSCFLQEKNTKNPQNCRACLISKRTFREERNSSMLSMIGEAAYHVTPRPGTGRSVWASARAPKGKLVCVSVVSWGVEIPGPNLSHHRIKKRNDGIPTLTFP